MCVVTLMLCALTPVQGHAVNYQLDSTNMQIALLHPRMSVEIGAPAYILEKDDFPAFILLPKVDGMFNCIVYNSDGAIVYRMPTKIALSNFELNCSFPVKPILWEQYRIEFELEGNREDIYFSVFDPLYFTDTQSKAVYRGIDGALKYLSDYRGNTIPDFSNAGYMGGGVSNPNANLAEILYPDENAEDDTERIQAAIDRVSALPLINGLRGAVLLKKGSYKIGSFLAIRADGVVLRGEGANQEGTILTAIGKTVRSLIQIAGSGNPSEVTGASVSIVDNYVPVGSRSFNVENANGFNVGDAIMVVRHGNADWIAEIGMDDIALRPGDPEATKQWNPFDLHFDRIITSITGNLITVDAPIVNSIETLWGGGRIYRYSDEKRISNAGVEDIMAVSAFDSSITAVEGGESYYSDMEHASCMVEITNAKNIWVKNLKSYHFSQHCVLVGRGTKWVTVEKCENYEMVGIIAGGTRDVFPLLGQLALVKDCYTEGARHAYYVSSRVCGPNVFLDCTSEKEYGASEPHQRWSVGGLYDNVRSTILVQDRQWMGSGHGWSGANYLLWNTVGNFCVQKPPTAQNYAIGSTGVMTNGSFPPRAEGYLEVGQFVDMRSIYLEQLYGRLGSQAIDAIGGNREREDNSVNYALKKAVYTPGGSLSASPPRNAVDGDKTTVWTLRADQELDVVQLTIDLGKSMLFNKVEITAQRYSYRISSYLLEYSSDGVNWDTMYLSSSPLANDATITISPVAARYVKLRATEIQSSHTGISEIEIYYDRELLPATAAAELSRLSVEIGPKGGYEIRASIWGSGHEPATLNMFAALYDKNSFKQAIFTSALCDDELNILELDFPISCTDRFIVYIWHEMSPIVHKVTFGDVSSKAR